MSERDKEPYWIDQVFEKHECMPYTDGRAIEFTHEGQSMVLIFPSYLPSVRVHRSVLADDLLFIIGRAGPPAPYEEDSDYSPGWMERHRARANPNPVPEPMPDEGPDAQERDGLLLVARHREGNVWWTVVWHELYPWALKFLGLRG